MERYCTKIKLLTNFELLTRSYDHVSICQNTKRRGPNAFLLSSDLAALFTGRTFEIKVFPFSFSEYMQYFGYSDKYTAVDKYMIESGMADSYLYKDQEAKYDYIADVFNTLIVRDIRKKYKIRNMQLMDRIVDFLMDNISNLTSARNITNTFSGYIPGQRTNCRIHG